MRKFSHNQTRLTPEQKALERALAPSTPTITYAEAVARVNDMNLSTPHRIEMTLSVALRFQRPENEIAHLLDAFESHTPPILPWCGYLWRAADDYPDLAVPGFARAIAALTEYLPSARADEKAAAAAFLQQLVTRRVHPATTTIAAQALTLTT